MGGLPTQGGQQVGPDAGLKVALPQEERPKKEEGGGSRRKVRVGGNSTHCRVHPSSRSFPLRKGHQF